MEIIGIISENSIQYAKVLTDVLAYKGTVALIDWRMPISFIKTVLDELDIKCLHLGTELRDKYQDVFDDYDLSLHEINNNLSIDKIPDIIYQNFEIINNNYSHDDAIILFSSGTTGDSKGIRLSYYAINNNVNAITNYWDKQNIKSIIITKSFSHSSTIIGELFTGLKMRLDIYVSSTKIQPSTILDFIIENKISIYCMNPTMLYLYTYMVRNRDSRPSILKYIYISGAICSSNLLKEAKKWFDKTKILNVYGLTELGPRVTAQRYEEYDESNSVGKPIDGVMVKIINDGREMDRNQKGIIHVKSNAIMNGYCINHVIRESLYKDWFNTGDIGYFNDDLNLVIVGRSDNMIVSGGHNIYPEHVEEVLESNDTIKECMVYGVEDPLYGKRLCCIFVKAADNFDRKDLVEFCKFRLATYEIPLTFQQVAAIPKTETGKKKRVSCS